MDNTVVAPVTRLALDDGPTCLSIAATTVGAPTFSVWQQESTCITGRVLGIFLKFFAPQLEFLSFAGDILLLYCICVQRGRLDSSITPHVPYRWRKGSIAVGYCSITASYSWPSSKVWSWIVACSTRNGIEFERREPQLRRSRSTKLSFHRVHATDPL